MNEGTMQLILLGSVILISILGVVTLIIVARLYQMHDVKTADGQYAWMIPSEWSELPGKMVDSQNKIVASLAELTVHNQQTSKLLQHLVNAAFSLNEEINGMKNASKK
jgi:hypothetical protein